MLARVGLKGFEGAYPKALSHGMRQRVALARTFALDAELLLMDEPFGALDAQTKLQLQDLLLSLCQESQRSVVFVTHDLSEAVAVADRVVVMSSRPGRIVADVPVDLPRPRSIRALQKNPRFTSCTRSFGATSNRVGVRMKADASRSARPSGGLHGGALWLAHAVFLTLALGTWEYASTRGWLSATFFGQPSGIARFLWDDVADGKLWTDLGWTLAGTVIAFTLGAGSAIGVGLAFVRFPALERFVEPYFSAMNVMPRIALAPLFILWFGLGLGSKVAIGFSLAFFIVLSATVAGVRGVSSDHVTLCRTLGAKPSQLFFQVTLPGAVPVLFSGLRLGLIYSLLGVVGGEIIASEKGLGQSLAYLGSTFNINGVFALLLVLAMLGVSVVRAMTWLEKRLLHWQ